ncbi:MAG: M20/M25/M40 family metallo-hydrolase [Alphaproteobacteria bacterium]|nr:M20/M25/M40 family metallo-hydrolase [Alphaproteobacteria bacterium]
MIGRLLGICALSLCASAAFAQPTLGVRNAVGEGATDAPAAEVLTGAQKRKADEIINAALSSELAYELLESLTTEIGPRLAGSEAEARARQWGVERLKALGFKNVRIETFELPYWQRVRESAAIVSPYPQQLAVTALGNSVATPKGGLQAEVVRFASLDELRQAPAERVKGKIVFVDEKMTRMMDGGGYGPAVAKRSGAANAAGRLGAAAAIIRSVGTDSHRMPHTGGMRYEDGVPQIPTAALSNPDADQLARALSYAEGPVMLNLELSVETRPAATSGNVIGEIPGRSDEIVVVGGHLDSWDLGTGAVDDGAGVAITTAAAKLVAVHGGKPLRTIRVVMWGSEEVGLHGARAYAKAHAGELERHAIASESDFGAGSIYALESRVGQDATGAIDEMQRQIARLGIIRGGNEASGGPDVSPLRAAGVPVFGLAQNGLDYFDLHHTPDDTLDKVDPADLKQNVAAWAAMIYLSANVPVDFRP